ncbi:MAG: hypothetical protein ABI615_05020 [Chthoniobacterales bacterium]
MNTFTSLLSPKAPHWYDAEKEFLPAAPPVYKYRHRHHVHFKSVYYSLTTLGSSLAHTQSILLAMSCVVLLWIVSMVFLLRVIPAGTAELNHGGEPNLSLVISND